MDSVDWIINSPGVRAIVGAGVLVGAVTAIGVFARRAWLALRELVQVQLAAGRIINAEMVRNGGSSMLDMVRASALAVKQIAPNHEEAIQHWAELAKADQQHLDRLGELDATMADWRRDLEGVMRRQSAGFRLVEMLFLELDEERQAHIRKLAEGAGFDFGETA